jgi:phosphatidylglycerophosphate synthase
MTNKQRRVRIVALLVVFIVLGFLATSGGNPLEQWLGWSGAGFVWIAVSAAILLVVVWDYLKLVSKDKDDL